MAPPSQRRADKRAFSVSFEMELIDEIEKACILNGKVGDYQNRNAFIKKATKEKLERESKSKKIRKNES